MITNKLIFRLILGFLLLSVFASGQNVFSVKGTKTYLNDEEILLIGLRCSNALLSDKTVDDLISHLDEYKEYGVNSLSVYFMGSRYSNINGYKVDASLNPVYADRMKRIIEACDKRDMVVLVGVLYWGSGMGSFTNDTYGNWTQTEVELAIQNTVKWLKENSFRNVFIDPDNEGMAHNGKAFDISKMISAAKKIDSSYVIAFNVQSYPPPNADFAIHYSKKYQALPYAETEGTPPNYWGEYSKEEGQMAYINVGVYTENKKQQQIKSTKEHLDKGYGYMLASTWLQNVPPNYNIGGDGTPCNPGIKWWMDFIKEYNSKK